MALKDGFQAFSAWFLDIVGSNAPISQCTFIRYMGVSINGCTPTAGLFMRENPNLKWMMTRGSPILGHPHISKYLLRECLGWGYRYLLKIWIRTVGIVTDVGWGLWAHRAVAAAACIGVSCSQFQTSVLVSRWRFTCVWWKLGAPSTFWEGTSLVSSDSSGPLPGLSPHNPIHRIYNPI